MFMKKHPCEVKDRAALINAGRVKKKRGGRVDRRGQAGCTPLSEVWRWLFVCPPVPSLFSFLCFNFIGCLIALQSQFSKFFCLNIIGYLIALTSHLFHFFASILSGSYRVVRYIDKPWYRLSIYRHFLFEDRQAALLWVRYGVGCLFALRSHFSHFFASILSGG